MTDSCTCAVSDASCTPEEWSSTARTFFIEAENWLEFKGHAIGCDAALSSSNETIAGGDGGGLHDMITPGKESGCIGRRLVIPRC